MCLSGYLECPNVIKSHNDAALPSASLCEYVFSFQYNSELCPHKRTQYTPSQTLSVLSLAVHGLSRKQCL